MMTLLKTYHHHNDKQRQFSLPKWNFVTYAVYALIAVALLYLFVDPAAPPTAGSGSTAASSTTKPSSLAAAARPPWIQQQQQPPPLSSSISSLPPSPYEASSSPIISTSSAAAPPCDYSDGEWVPDARPPLYDGTTCGAIKDDGRSCTANGRADTGYVHWRWQPRACDLPDFSADAFLRWLRNRHVAFVGDSLARNQAESLVCLLSSRSPSPPDLAHRSADGRFRRWVFRDDSAGNATVSVFWSPFLLRGVEKSERDGVRYNQVFLDAFDERWMSELHGIDVAVLSAGHWFRIPSVYHRGGRVVGCHGCDDYAAEFNRTVAESTTSFFSVFRDAVRRTLAEAARRHRHQSSSGAGGKKPQLVAFTTFSPSHFEGHWNEGAPCKKKADRELGYTETEMRKIVVEAVEEAASTMSSNDSAQPLRFAALDVTALANMRPDGHPGPYMRKNPFAGGGGNNTGDHRPVQHDCLHWCMPGPVDTFNQILLQTILRAR
ncbi:Protein ALTERED XYLOGLUCAN 4 [Zea mays]|uniref:Protein ALTERED XYLOGLUCAN 4 n=1 Tax=Zea mays TaxID=4577 RepID=A0A3L6F7Y5_MAIZE|nr:Protein ALTERED XYLOGLUCAN 4 [Zea mays]